MKKINDKSSLKQDIDLITLNEASQIIMHFALYPDWRSEQNPTVFPKENYPRVEILDTDKITLLNDPLLPYFRVGQINNSDKITAMVSKFSGYVGLARVPEEIDMKNFIEHFIKLEEKYRETYAKYQADSKNKNSDEPDQTIQVCISTGKIDDYTEYLKLVVDICCKSIEGLGDKSELNIEMFAQVQYIYPNICKLASNLCFDTPKRYFFIDDDFSGEYNGLDVKELLG